ncbi:MAG: hypothetical protein R3F34_03810 [Planctomycetota bacterium]
MEAQRPARSRGTRDCLIFGDPAHAPLAIDAARLVVGDGPSWNFVEGAPRGDEWHGAAVVARSDGKLIGIVLADDEGTRIATDLPQGR